MRDMSYHAANTLPDGKRLAGFSDRLLAHQIDLVLLLPLAYLLHHLLESNLFLFSSLVLLYFLLQFFSEISVWGGSPGKRMLGISVLDSRGESPGITRVFARNVLKICVLILFFPGFFFMLFNRKKQGLHDLLSGILVVRSPERTFPWVQSLLRVLKKGTMTWAGREEKATRGGEPSPGERKRGDLRF